MVTKRCIVSTIAVFAVSLAVSYFYFYQFLMPHYTVTPELWRAEEEMKEYGIWCYVRQFVLAAVIACLFAKNYEAKGIGEGVRFGLYVGLIMGLVQFGSFIYMPISLTLGLLWLLGQVIYGVLAGIVLSLVYQKVKA